MTDFTLCNIRCDCGNEFDIKIYKSVNVSVHPELIDEVKNRRVNGFECEKCGRKVELLYTFIYNDMNRSQWIFVIPKLPQYYNKTEKSRAVGEAVMTWQNWYKNMRDIGLKEPQVVFGYDELFNLLNL